MDWITTDENRRLAEQPLLAESGGFTHIWQPDWRASLPLALALTLLALSGLMLFPYHWWRPAPQPKTISIQLDQALPETVKPHSRKPVHSRTPVSRAVPKRDTIKPPAPPPQSPPVNWQLQMNQAAKTEVKTKGETQFMAPRTKPQDKHLERMLNTPQQTTNLQNGDAYRSTTGQLIIKSGNYCGRVMVEQMSSSPTNKAVVGFYAHCPGEYKPTMGEDLKHWADKWAKKHPPP